MISDKTIADLELDKVKEYVAGKCRTAKGERLAMGIRPFKNRGALLNELKQTNEFLSSFQNDNRFPNLDFEEVDHEIKMLGIENAYIQAEGFINIRNLSATSNELIKFLEKFHDYYPTLQLKLRNVYHTPALVEGIDKVMEPDARIRDNASPALKAIRRELTVKSREIDSQFNQVLARARAAGHLDDIGESVMDHRRVLAVSAMHRKKVKGSLLGTSKTGSIVFVEPESTQRLNRQLNELEMEEKQEVIRILKGLTDLLRPYEGLLNAYQKLLTEFDLIQAKARYAQEISACLPYITRDKFMNVRDAYHPLLLLQNRQDKVETIPQNIMLDPEQRIIVISGPNAGGKSITLKTIGLIQVMLQCGLLVPVHEKSKMTLFDSIMTDIGDNQSIENHLSTYSYRLKNMSRFLKKCDENTLFLIDEFGTGSDPELGGALAEVFLEEFYERSSYGVITTHYTNIKLLVEQLPAAINACMLFDEKTLKPTYQLFVGQAGSSFTFEVAQMNGIPYRLINRAKKRVEREKIQLDKTIAKLQKEKSAIETKSRSLTEAEAKAKDESEKLERINDKISDKLEAYQDLFDRNTKRLAMARKMEALTDQYYFRKLSKKQMLGEFVKMVEMENAKKREKEKARQEAIEKEKQAAAQKKEKAKKAKILSEQALRKKEQRKEEELQKVLEKDLAPIREEKKKQEAEAKKKPKVVKPTYILKVDDKVRMIGGTACGIIDKIEKDVAFVDYGMFQTQTKLDQLELVVAAKRKK